MIDTSKPWFPQDYPLEEVLAVVTDNPFFSEAGKLDRVNEVKEDYRIRKGGPAGIFFDLRRHIENALHGQQIHEMPQYDEAVTRIKLDEHGQIRVDPYKFMNTLDEVISLAIIKFEGSNIPDARFAILDYAAVAVRKVDDKVVLFEETRPCGDICQAYWDLVSQEKADCLEEPTS